MFEDMERLHRQLDGLLGHGIGLDWNLPFSRFSFLPGRAARSYPLVNVSEHPDHFRVDALAPALDPDSLELSFHDRTLTLQGRKTSIPEDISADRVQRLERSAGTFHRTVRVGSEVDPEGIRADYRDGILTVTLPKSEAARPRQIQVRVG
jgi:HSP20 family protein